MITTLELNHVRIVLLLLNLLHSELLIKVLLKQNKDKSQNRKSFLKLKMYACFVNLCV